MKTIMVPTDFSEHALYALKVAAILAAKTKAKIKLVHVFNLPSKGVSEVAYYQNFFNDIKAKAERQIEELAQSRFLKGVPVEKHFEAGRLIWQFVTGEKFKNISLIVMGAFGESGFSKVFIGSNTEKVVRLATTPVLTIKKDPGKFIVKKIVFASDFEKECFPAFKRVKSLIDLFNPELHLLKVITPYDFEPTPVSMKKMHSFTRHFSLKNCSPNIFNYPKTELGIMEYSHSVNADLIVIPTHGRTGLAHFFSGSLAENLAKHESIPVLSIKIPAPSKSSGPRYAPPLNYENWGQE